MRSVRVWPNCVRIWRPARAMTYMVMSRAQAGIQDSQSSLMRAMVGETQQRATAAGPRHSRSLCLGESR